MDTNGAMDLRAGAAAGKGGGGRSFAGILIALLLAVACAAAAYAFRGDTPLWMVALAGFGSFMGLLFLVGIAAGFVHVGSLPRQRAFYDGLFEALGDALVVTDARGRAIYANSAYRALLAQAGLPRQVGVENVYSGYPEIAERIYRLSQAAREGREGREDVRLAAGSAAAGAKPDRAVWLSLSVAPIAAGQGKHTLWRHTDITAERSQQEHAFGRLQHIINYLDHAPSGFFSTAADGRIEYVNATLAGWLELDLAQTSDGSLKLADIVTREGAKVILGLAPASAGESARTEVFDLDLRGRGGQIIPARVIHRVEFDERGMLLPSRSIVLDRRSESTQGAAHAEARLSRLFNDAPIGMAMVDGQGRITNANTSFLKLSPEARRGAVLEQIVTEGGRRALRAALSGVYQGGQNPVQAADVSFMGDQPRSVQMFVSRGEDGGPGQGVVVFAVDMTAHRALEIQLAQSQKMQAIGQLAGGVAHDFNNVLTAIIGFSDLLLARHRATDPAFQDIMNIKQNANRAANLVRKLLAFSRRQTLRPEVLSLTDVIADLGNLLGRLLGEKVELKVSHARDVGHVKVDVNQFEQVIMNLAVNARDAMPEGGVLTVRTANVGPEEAAKVHPGLMPAGDYVLCEVSDTGTGMPPEVMQKIYEPFFSTKEVGKGTGLGLSTVYGIVKQTGGFIFCDSRVGEGTVFRIYLPRHEPEAEAAREVVKAEPEKQDLTGRGTVLLVEDEDAVRAFASRALQSRGYKVVEADSGESALGVIESGEPIDLVLSDVVMPEMDGPTLLKELRRRGIKTKVVFISGYAEDAFEKNLEGQQDFAFLPKPFTLKQLAETVKKAMEGG